MKARYNAPLINVTLFDCETISAADPLNNPQFISGLSINAYGMQNYTTLQKVSHDIMQGNPTVQKILEFHVH